MTFGEIIGGIIKMVRFNKILILLFVFLLNGCSLLQKHNEKQRLHYEAVERKIVVDGHISDWQDIKANIVQGKDNLWIGQGMTLDNWYGNKDLSYSWRATWCDDKLYFLFEVNDDSLQKPIQEYSWLNDCVEICLDYMHLKGPRKEEIGNKEQLRGYELHFLPSFPPRVFLNEIVSKYLLEEPQNEAYIKDWSGETEVKKTIFGYIMEIGFSVPGFKLKPDLVMGIETGVCDDDGASRKSLMIWTGKQVDFWISMDDYGEVKLARSN